MHIYFKNVLKLVECVVFLALITEFTAEVLT